MGTTVLFDDERSFSPGFRDGARVLRTADAAREFFGQMAETGLTVDELWLDFNLASGSTVDALPSLPGAQVRRVIFHSSAWSARALVELFLRKAGYAGEVELPPEGKIFS